MSGDLVQVHNRERMELGTLARVAMIHLGGTLASAERGKVLLVALLNR